MSLNQNYDLPGVLTEISTEYSSGIDTSLFGSTDSVLIMGTAFNGPIGKVVEVYSPEYGRYVFGGSYDSKSKKESSLVTAIQDCWDRGCRTIYGLRVSGKEIFKDYQLGVDTNLKLRVKGRFPSNKNKDLSFVVVNDGNEFYVEVYKPATFATIREKKNGLVESPNSILVNKIELDGAGVGVDSDLVDLITRVNTDSQNNVFTLSVVDEDGRDVTYEEAARSIRAGVIFPGLYTIGRSKNVSSQTITEVNLKKVGEEFLKDLSINTDVSKDIPVCSNLMGLDVSQVLGVAGLNEFDFLKVPGKIDDVFEKDSIDYEEVGISKFDLYKRLGSGFAINAEVVEVAPSSPGRSARYKVVEVADKENRVTPIKDGIYSMVQNLRANYRVLAGVSADDEIKNRLPKISDFKYAKPVEGKLLNNVINIKAKTKEDELTLPREFKIKFEKITSEQEIVELEGIKDGGQYYFDKTAKEVSHFNNADFTAFKTQCISSKLYPIDGSLFLVDGITVNSTSVIKLYQFRNKVFEEVVYSAANKDSLFCSHSGLYKFEANVNTLAAVTSLQSEVIDANGSVVRVPCSYFSVQLANGTFITKKISVSEAGEASLLTLGTVEQLFIENEEFYEEGQIVMATHLSSAYSLAQSDSAYKNEIIIRSSMFDWLSVDDTIEILKKDKDFSKMFEIEIGLKDSAQDTIGDLITSQVLPLPEKTIGINTAKRISFRTDDLFCRQLAQHCIETSMRTASTHGIIGVSKILDPSLDSIAKRVEQLISLDISSSIIAKKENGTNILTKDNLPYEIGNKISIPVAQYTMRTEDNYTFTSNFAAGYAGMVSVLPLEQSSTSQPARIPTPNYDLTAYQLTRLSNSGFVTVKNSYNKGYVVTDGITMASPESSYKRLSAMRVTDACESLIRRACEPFIGKQNSLFMRNSLETAIASELSKIAGVLIEKFDFDILEDKQSAKLGVIKIDYKIVPIYEIKQINNSIVVKEA